MQIIPASIPDYKRERLEASADNRVPEHKDIYYILYFSSFNLGQPVRNLAIKDGGQEDMNIGSDLGEEEMEVESEKEEEKPKAGSFANSLSSSSSLNVLRPGTTSVYVCK